MFAPGQPVRVVPINPETELAAKWAKAYPESYQASHAGIDEPLITYECNGPGRFPGECSVLVFPAATFEVMPDSPLLKVRRGDQTFRAFVPESLLKEDDRKLAL
jgi:hypothetical protein